MLTPGAPAWIVVAGADFQHVYVPADLALAELAAERGFEVERVVEARRLRRTFRRLGEIQVAPREVVLMLRRR